MRCRRLSGTWDEHHRCGAAGGEWNAAHGAALQAEPTPGWGWHSARARRPFPLRGVAPEAVDRVRSRERRSGIHPTPSRGARAPSGALIDDDPRDEVPRAADLASRLPQRSRQASRPDLILLLQRTAGNAAVRTLFEANRRGVQLYEPEEQSVQRCGSERHPECPCTESEPASVLQRLPEQKDRAEADTARAVTDRADLTTPREARHPAFAIEARRQPSVPPDTSGLVLQRHKDDIVAYSGGQSGSIDVIAAGKLIGSFPAVSGSRGRGENEPGAGPIPAGSYKMHPRVAAPKVSSMQWGVCGASRISQGFQEITSSDPSPCSGGAHYCNVPCPTAAQPSRMCFTPVDCWGPMRIKIEGSAAVVTPAGTRAVRDGFYIHGGNPADAVTSGCVKTLDNAVFAEIRRLTGVNGVVPFCVDPACPPLVKKARAARAAQAVAALLEAVRSWPAKLISP